MMTTPTRDVLHRRRRSMRQALAVIPDMTSSSLSPGSPLPTEVNTLNNSRYSRESWSPAPSPDELVIQKRGRRSRTIIWSPDADAKRDSLLSLSLRDRTPVKHSPTKAASHLKSTPRKRLLLDDNDHMTPEKSKINENLMNGLRELSNDQLIKIIMDIVSMQEGGVLSSNDKLREVILNRMPIANIQPWAEKLIVLKQNIYSSLMSTFESNYNQALTNLEAFEKTLLEQGKELINCQDWTAVMHYVFLAWTITNDLPIKTQPNNVTQKCFRNLTQFCKHALLNGNFINSTLEVFIHKMEMMVHDYDEMKVCHQMAKEMIRL